MAKKAESNTDAVSASSTIKTEPFVKSRKRTSLDEFAITHRLRPEMKAGFKVWLKGELHHFDDEWETLFKNYTNRQLK